MKRLPDSQTAPAGRTAVKRYGCLHGQKAGTCMLDWQRCKTAKGADSLSALLHRASPGSHLERAAMKSIAEH